MADSPDPYGIDLRLSDQGDLVVAPNGALTAVSGPENCGQALALRVRTHPGELPLQIDYGSHLASKLVGQKANDPDLARSIANVELRALVEADRRFLAARDIQATDLTADGTRLAIRLLLRLAGGEQLRVGDLGDVRLDEISAATVVDPTLDDTSIDAVTDDLAFLADANDDLNELPELDSFLNTDPTDPSDLF